VTPWGFAVWGNDVGHDLPRARNGRIRHERPALTDEGAGEFARIVEHLVLASQPDRIDASGLLHP